MEDRVIASLLIHFANLPDPRQAKNQKHRMLDVVIICICGVLVGCDGARTIVRWAQAKQEWLKRFLLVPNGIPSRDCVRRILTLLKPEAFEECFRSWIKSLLGYEDAAPDHIAIDGKTLCGSHDRAHNQERWIKKPGDALLHHQSLS